MMVSPAMCESRARSWISFKEPGRWAWLSIKVVGVRQPGLLQAFYHLISHVVLCGMSIAV